MPDNIEVSKIGILMSVFIGLMFTIIISLIGLLGVQIKTGCWGECDPVCATQQCAASTEINPYNIDNYHPIPEPSTLLLMGAGVGVLIKMRS